MSKLHDIVDAILPLIPESEEIFRSRWKAYQSDISFLLLPEHEEYRWRQGAIILNECLPRVSSESWQSQIEDIWFEKVKG